MSEQKRLRECYAHSYCLYILCAIQARVCEVAEQADKLVYGFQVYFSTAAVCVSQGRLSLL